MSAKLIRDPLYKYVGIDRRKDERLLELLRVVMSPRSHRAERSLKNDFQSS